MFRRIRSLLALVLVTAAYFAVVQPGAADTNGPFWTCRGSVGYLGSTDATKPGRIELMAANTSDPKQPSPCANDDAGQTQPFAQSSEQGSLSVQTVYAGTRISPVIGASSQQVASAVGQVSSVQIQNADGSFKLTADVTKAGVQGSCNGGAPGFADTGAVTNVNINGQAVPNQCDPYSLYVQLSRCRSLDSIILISKARERNFVGNKVPENMVAAEERLELLSEATIREAESRDWTEKL